MKRGLMAAIICFILAGIMYCPEVKAASLKTISETSDLRDESRYIIYSGNKQTAMFDDGGSQEGWLKKGTYSESATLNNLCKFWWEIVKGEDGYYLYNVGTGFPVKGQGTNASGYLNVVSDKGDGSAKGLYTLEKSGSGFKIKSNATNKYFKYGENGDYITLVDDANSAAVWTIDEVHSRLSGSMYIWKTQTASNYYRIPAIATANNGDVIAAADIRYGTQGDLGSPYGKRIDVVTKKSKDNGVTWPTESNNLTEGSGESNFGFGDPGIVADRDSDKVLILCATGRAGYVASNRNDLAGVSAIVSDDNGETFGEPIDLTQQIYDLKEEWQGLFVASGRIMQSRYVKLGDYYRLYCSVLTRVSAGTSTNAIYILYSDDFGTTWNILGGKDVSPVVAGDEAKLEELPDGSVVVSSRKMSGQGNGRFINIYKYNQDDPTFTAGAWGTKGSVDIGRQAQGTNGELLIVYAKETATNEYKFLALHSIPTGSDQNPGQRRGVGIYYKVLGDQDSEVSSFVSGWDYTNAFYKVQAEQSGYSTMTVQKDGSLGFFYEDSPSWYDLVYLNLDLKTITNNKYEMAFKEGIGSEATPFKVTTSEQAEAVLSLYNNEGVHWEFSGEALTYVTSELYPDLAAKIAAAQAVYDTNGVDAAYDAAVRLDSAIEEARTLTESSDGNTVMAAIQELEDAVQSYEYIASLLGQITAKTAEAEALLATNRIEAERKEAVALQEAINAAKGDNSQATYVDFRNMLADLAEKMEAYEQADTETFSVEARYNSNNIRFTALDGVTQYKISKSNTENGSYTEVETITADDSKASYSYIDEAAGTNTQLWYKVEAVKDGNAESVVLGPLRDEYATGIEAVQKHALEGQYHKDFRTGNNTEFNGSRMDEATAEEIAKVAGLNEGTFLISYKPQATTGRKVIFTVKQVNANVTTNANLANNAGFVFYQEGTNIRIDASHALKANFNGHAPTGEWSTFGYVNTLYSTEGVNNVLTSRNGSTPLHNGTKLNYSRSDMNGFIGKNTNLGTMTIGAGKNNTTATLHYSGEIAYVTITDEVFSENELNAYTAALNATLTGEIITPATPAAVQGFRAEAGDGQVVLSWTALTENVTGYEVSKDGGSSWEAASSNTGHTFTGLENGREYTFKVRAVNETVRGEEATATATPEGTAPVAGKVATPTFSVEAGTYTEVKTVEISTETEGATIYYTINGDEPTTNSTEYSGEITVDETMTIKAMAVKADMENSEIAEAAYVINIGTAEKDKVAAPAFSVAGGSYTEVKSVELTTTTAGADIYYTLDGSTPTANSTRYSKAITVDKTMTIKAIALKDGMEDSEVAEASYTINIPADPNPVVETVAAPTFSVEGGTYTEVKSVELSTKTAGATIYYTTDGTTPTMGSTKYSKAISVDKTMTIKAIAVKEGMKNSAVATAAYTINIKPNTPIEKPWIFTDVDINPGAWKYESVKYVYNNDIMGAISGTTLFQPDRSLSRSMFATVLYRMADEPAVTYEDTFSDVPAGKWYSDAIIWANKNGIVQGLGDGSFGIDANITREQIAKMLYEYADKVCKYNVSEKKDLAEFTDADAVSSWAIEYMQWATAVEMITGKPNDAAQTSFRMDPKGEATRAECAAMLSRFESKYQ